MICSYTLAISLHKRTHFLPKNEQISFIKTAIKQIAQKQSDINYFIIDSKGTVRFGSGYKSTPRPQAPKPSILPPEKQASTKPELIPGDANWDKVISAIKGGFTIEQVKSKYSISEINEANLKLELV